MPTSAELHKVNHLLTHVLNAAVARRWPQVNAGDSGETREGFFGDFAFEPVPPTAEELALLEGDMRRILAECRRFEHREKTPAQAAAFFAGNPFKLKIVETLAELDETVGFYALDDFQDVCSCQIKELCELKAIGPGAFALTGTTPALWRLRDKEVWLTRIHGVQAAALAGRVGVTVNRADLNALRLTASHAECAVRLP
jgi:threonyl-tRNA synthetase